MPCPRSLKLAVIPCALLSAFGAPEISAHTNSVGYANAGAGAVTFWYGTYHLPNEATYTEGSFQVVGTTNGFIAITPFTLLTATKPAGLIDGTTNFYASGGGLSATNSGQPVATWQGVTITALEPGDYTFTYIPIANPTAVWNPLNGGILSNTITLTPALTGGSGFQPNATSPSSPAAGMLDQITDTATGEMADVITALQGMSAEEQRAVLQHIAPETSRAVNQASTQVVSGVLDTVAVRLDGIRAQGYAATVADDLENNRRILLAAEGDLSSLSSGDTTAKRSVWGKAFGSHAEQKMQDGFAGYLADTGGAAIGIDTLLDNEWVVGGAFTYADTDVSMRDFRAGDGADIDTYQVTAYGSRDFGKWFLEAMLAYARQNFSTTRNTGISGIAVGDFDGDLWAARITAGWPIAMGQRVTVTPMAGLEWNYLKQDGYTETGGGPLSQTVESESADRLRSALGVRVGTQAELGNFTLRPSVHLFWRHEFFNDGIDSTATFTGGGAAFTTPGQDITRNTFNIGAQITMETSKSFQLSIRADADYGDRYSAYAGQLLAQWRF
jgi:outer membrane autotransporter protein